VHAKSVLHAYEYARDRTRILKGKMSLEKHITRFMDAVLMVREVMFVNQRSAAKTAGDIIRLLTRGAEGDPWYDSGSCHVLQEDSQVWRELVALSTSENTVGSTVPVHESAEEGGRSATTSNFVIELPRIRFLANEKWLISNIF
jgi:hypothetical protein